MRNCVAASGLLFLSLCATALNAAPKVADVSAAFSRLPLAFEPAPEPGKFVTSAGVEVAPAGVAMGSQQMRLVGVNPASRGVGEEPLPGQSHYFTGNDPRRWRTHVPNYARIRYRNVYPGIDVVYYGRGREVEFDFVVTPGADPRRIQLAMSGPEVTLRVPRIYQGESNIEGRAARNKNRVTFELAAYDRSRPLVIDPVLSFARLVGGGSGDSASAIAVDRSGATYVTGSTSSVNFAAGGAPSRFGGGGADAFVSKLSADGATLLYSVYLGGSGFDNGNAIAVDAAGNAYVAGYTTSIDFPRVNAAQGPCGPSPPPSGSPCAGDAFVARLSADGSALLYSTNLGGDFQDSATGIAADSGGNAYVTGNTWSLNFPTRSPFQAAQGQGGFQDGFVTKFSPSGSMVYSTYLGGRVTDTPRAIAVDSAGSAYVTGSTFSANFPIKDALQPTYNGSTLGGNSDSFITKLSADGSTLVWSTFLGGSGTDEGNGLALDASGNVYIAGRTSSHNFPVVNALQGSSPVVVLQKTIDGAAHWSDAGLPGIPSVVAVDPANGSTIYAALSDSPVLLKSSDGGATWSKVLTEEETIYTLAIDPVSPSTVYAGSYGVIFKTTDGGDTWKSLKYGGASVFTLAVDPKNSSIVYAGSGGGMDADGVFKSTDGGETWARTSLRGPGSGIRAFAIDPSNPSTLFAATGNGSSYRSADGGGTFTMFRSTQFFYISRIVVDPANSAMVYVIGYGNDGYQGVFKSADGGQSWRDTGIAGAVNINSLVIDPGNSSTLYASTSAGLFKTTDGGGRWSAIHSGNRTVNALAIGGAAPATLYASSPVTGDAFVARLNADGQSYLYSTYLGGGDADSATSIAVDASGNAYVAGSTGSGDFPTRGAFLAARSASSDGFVAKLAANGSAVAFSSYVGGAVNGLVLGPGGAIHLAGTWTGPDFFSTQPQSQSRTSSIVRSDDGGTTWAGAALPTDARALAVDPRNPSRLFATSPSGIHRSTDAGRSWSLLSLDGQFVLNALAIDPATPSTLWVVRNGVFKSSDGGENWRVTQGLQFGGPSLAVDPRNPSVLYHANRMGVSKSTDGGETWAPIASGPSFGVASLVVVDSRSTLYASFASGWYKTTDGGADWALVTSSAPTPVEIMAIDPATPTTFYIGGAGGLYRSTDGGASFTRVYTARVRAIAIDPSSPSTLYLAPQPENPGLLKSTDRGATWRPTGLTVPVVNALAMDPSTPGRVYAATSANPSDAFVIKVVE